MSRAMAKTLFVTGKGGAGKSLVAREIAAEAAARDLRVALVDAVDPSDSSDEHVDAAVDAGIERIVLDPREALRRLLGRTLRFGFLADRLMDSRTFSAVAAAAPALADLVRMDCVRDLARGRMAGTFDLVVVNAPASGHGVALLEAPRRIGDIAAGGPGAAVAGSARQFTCDAQCFRAVAVALPEELSVVETAELHHDLRRLNVAATATVVNGVYPALANSEQAAWLASHPVSDDVRLYLARRERQLALAAAIESPGAPLLLPYLFDGAQLPAVDRARLFESVNPSEP
jgi:anion-transporting  ArsA/GET3 family ATPase